MQEWCEGHKSVLQILAERESVFRLLPQTTSENLVKDWKNYTPNPLSRYPNFNKYLYATHQMTHLYLSDQLEHADMPRNKYIKMQKKNPTTSRLRLQQQMQQSQQYKMSQYSDEDIEEDERICEIDKRIEMRKKMLAEEKAQNDPSQYFTNRAKMMKDKQEQKPNEKVKRLEAMAKISETFGYGERIKKESPPLKKPLIPTEPKQNRRKVVKPPAPTKDLVERVELSSMPKKSGVKKWEFEAPPSAKPRSKKSGSHFEVDPELDGMLAQLETDEEFSKLSDNEQIAWLESLFFLDTPSKQASSGLVKPRARDLPSGESRRPVSSTMPSTKVDCTSQVSAKSLSIQSNAGFKSKAKPEEPMDDPEDEAKGVSKDKMALAMSFFANDSKNASKKPDVKKPAKKKATTSVEDELPVVHNATAKPFSKATRERAYFEPEGSSEREEDEEDFVPNFAAARKSSASSRNAVEQQEAPPVPSRSGENKHLMLKLMKNATNALRSWVQ